MSIRDERKLQTRQALLDAALTLSTSDQSFSNMSLRALTKEVGLVPAAFYRHFQDMDELGKELVDQVSFYLKHILHQLVLGLAQPDSNTQKNMQRFFDAVDTYPQQWKFMIAERWGGSAVVRQAIAREIEFLNDDLAHDLHKYEIIQNFENPADLNGLTNILINLSFTWAISWLNLKQQYQASELELQKLNLHQQTVIQFRLIFRGISNWENRK